MPAMPVYEYACTACGERTEKKQGFDDPPLQECPICGGKLRKLYSPVGIVFKGSGFYSTDKVSKKDERKTTDKPDKKKAASKSGTESTSSSTEKAKS